MSGFWHHHYNARKYSERDSYDPNELTRNVRAFVNNTSTPSHSRSHSLVSTDTRESSNMDINDQLTRGRSTTHTVYNLPPVRSTIALDDISEENNYRYTYSQRITSSFGKQAISILGSNGTYVTPTTLADSTGIYNKLDLAAIKAQIASGSPPASGAASVRFTVPHSRVDYYLTSTSNAVQMVYIYDVVPRVNIEIGITSTTPAQQQGDTAVADPIQAWRNGYPISFGGITAAAGADIPFATPFESKLFCEWFKVISVKKITQAPGDMHHHVVKSNQHRWISDAQWLTQTGSTPTSAFISTVNKFGRHTVLTMVVAIGGPVHDIDVNTAVSTAATGLDVISKKTYSFRWSQDFIRTNIDQTSLPTVGAPTGAHTVPQAQGSNTVVGTN